MKPSHGLTIASVPFQSSRLTIPPSPGSPRSPLTCPILKFTSLSTSRRRGSIKGEPPAEPLPWVWQCHLCKRVYRLTTTSRCLEDGHRFCAGVTVTKRSKKTGKKVTKHKACASEFDYLGWQRFGDWRRSNVPFDEDDYEQNCYLDCNYPSQCRWKVNMAPESADVTPTRPQICCEIDASLQDIMIESTPIGVDALPTNVDVESPTRDALELSEKRRRRRSGGQHPSPLHSSPASDVESDQMQERAVEDSFAESRKSTAKSGFTGLGIIFGGGDR